ncbi:MAG: asparagine synthase (glutamine-hydrolyzing) [Planctomycetota bacterium]|nr:asparagine synthase (glutamine-hydrolyzing) [Planctomycetota bacterium]
MCGLCGIAYHDPSRSPDREQVLAMADTLAHRGPDDRDAFVSGPVGLGFRRLSIIDLEGGRQPLFNEDGDVVLVVNGEIYNFRELRAGLEERGHRFKSSSDVEVIVHLYEERGAALVDDLVGMFAFALLDMRKPTPRVLLGRDRVGIKPLYYAETAAGIAWASEPKALLHLEETPRRLVPEALLDFLVQGYVGGERSAWEGLRRLPPGHTLSWEPGGAARIARYWDLPRDALREPAEPEEILEWLDRTVEDRLVADVPLGAFLSGGIDSTAVVTSMARASDDPVIACSVGFHERTHDELAIARATAERVGAVHHTRVLEADPTLALDTLPWFFDEPHADPSNVPTYLVSKCAREHVTVALSGDGGDETFGGYRRYVHDVAENRLRRGLGAPGRALARAAGSVYPRLDWAPRFLRGRTFLTNVGDHPARAYWRSVTQLDRDEALALLHPDVAARLVEHDPFEAFAAHYGRPAVDDPLYRAQYADFHTYLPDQILAKVDRASMAVSLEVRVPLLDHRFCGRFANLPAGEKVRGGRGKHAFREALRGRIPGDVLDGRKRGFDTPLTRWIRGPLAEPVGHAIESLAEDWFDRAVLRRLLEEHRGGRRDHGRLLWSLLVLERWASTHGVTGLAA